jgi:hypothetical protein
MDATKLAEVLASSKLYWETDGEQGAIADLRGADLYGADLTGATLTKATLYVADLYGANLSGANLYGANLSGANLSGANLSGANLTGATLTKATLYVANLSGADLTGANLRGADLYGAIGLAPVTEPAVLLLLNFADRVTQNPETLHMKDVHYCDTTHCGAGWICTLSPVAKTLETLLGWNAAACIVCPIPEFTGLFYATDAEMMAFAQSVVDDRGAAIRAKYGLPIPAV